MSLPPASSATTPNSLNRIDASARNPRRGPPAAADLPDFVLGISTEGVKSPLPGSAARTPTRVNHEQRDCQDDHRRSNQVAGQRSSAIVDRKPRPRERCPPVAPHRYLGYSEYMVAVLFTVARVRGSSQPLTVLVPSERRPGSCWPAVGAAARPATPSSRSPPVGDAGGRRPSPCACRSAPRSGAR